MVVSGRRVKFNSVFLRYVIECPNCSVIYRSRQYWYGNQDPVDTVVRTEIHHVWPGVRNLLKYWEGLGREPYTCLNDHSIFPSEV